MQGKAGGFTLFKTDGENIQLTGWTLPMLVWESMLLSDACTDISIWIGISSWVGVKTGELQVPVVALITVMFVIPAAFPGIAGTPWTAISQ